MKYSWPVTLFGFPPQAVFPADRLIERPGSKSWLRAHRGQELIPERNKQQVRKGTSYSDVIKHIHSLWWSINSYHCWFWRDRWFCPSRIFPACTLWWWNEEREEEECWCWVGLSCSVDGSTHDPEYNLLEGLDSRPLHDKPTRPSWPEGNRQKDTCVLYLHRHINQSAPNCFIGKVWICLNMFHIQVLIY